MAIVKSLTIYEYTVKYFGKQNSKLFMRSLDVDSLFTNFQLEETIGICNNTLFKNAEGVKSLSKLELRELLCLATK